MSVIARVLDNQVKSDGTITTELSVSAGPGLYATFTESRVEAKAKNRALLHNGYDKLLSEKGRGPVSIDIKVMEETNDGIGYNTFYVVTEIEGATKFLEQ